MWYEHAGVRFKLTRKPMKTIRIRIRGDSGEVRVSAPKWASDRDVRQFVAEKSTWIRHHVERIAGSEHTSKSLDWDALEAKRQQLQDYASARLPSLAKQIGVTAMDVRVKKMHTRWGSCNVRTGRVWLSLMLADKAPELIDYVLVHELVHLHEASHSARFYRLMDQYLPNWQRFDKELNPNRRRRL